ncbi:MAG: hypothetical protein PHO10_06755 [Gemmiger sp.]|nr:hypothetical protein [Gemmiger sp.]
MKKIIAALSTFLLLLVSTLSVFMMGEASYFDALYKNRTSVYINSVESASAEEVLATLNAVSESCSVEIARHIASNQSDIRVYTTRTEAYPAASITNPLAFLGGAACVTIEPIENFAKNAAAHGYYFINSTDAQVVAQAMAELGTLGEVTQFSTYPTFFGYTLERLAQEKNAPAFYLLVAAIFLILLALFTMDTTKKSKEIAIYQSLGFTRARATFCLLRNYRRAFATGMSATAILLLAAGFWLGAAPVLVGLAASVIMLATLVTLCAAVCFAATVSQQSTGLVCYLKGDLIFSHLLEVQILIKYLLLGICSFLLVYTANLYSEAATQLQKQAVWQQAENVYTLVLKYMEQSRDEQRTFEKKTKLFFEALLEKENVFLIAPSFTTDPQSGEIVASSIVVDKNYLARHSIKTAAGTSAAAQLVTGDTVRNILVPQSYQAQQDSIERNMRELFFFQKYGVPRMLGYEEPSVSAAAPQASDLTLNIIYIPDDIVWFSYDPTVNPNTQNCVINPLVIVDTNNVDTSFYFSYLSSSVFFETKLHNAYDEIAPLVAQYGLESYFESVRSVYDDYAADLARLLLARNLALAATLILAAILGVSVYLLQAAYFITHQKSITVRHLHGYLLLRILGKILICQWVLDFVVLLISSNIVWAVAATLVDVMIILYTGRRNLRSTITTVLKGGC